MEVGRVERLGDSALDRSEKFGKEGLTFDDVLLVPAESAVLPNDVSAATRLTRTIVLEVPVDEVEAVKAVVQKTMESVCELNVPLVVDLGFGPNWAEAK